MTTSTKITTLRSEAVAAAARATVAYYNDPAVYLAACAAADVARETLDAAIRAGL